jgi:pyrroloquinoline quinone biosynthesis protein B
VRLRVLGSAAGGGFPQWNCGCSNCRAVRAGRPGVRARTQDSLAYSLTGDAWHLVNASPDVLQQIAQTPELHPQGLRSSPIRSIALTNGDLDHVLGLFSLREAWPLVVYATAAVWQGLEGRNAIVRTLRRFPEQLTWRQLVLHCPVEVEPGLTLEARPARGKLPVHLVGLTTESPEDNIALWIRDSRASTCAVIAAASSSADGWDEAFAGADCVFFDGTFFSSDELVTQGLSFARAKDMAHVPIGGEEGSLARLAGAPTRRKVYTHINNSNPILVEGSPEQRAVQAAGWEIAYDGMEVSL